QVQDRAEQYGPPHVSPHPHVARNYCVRGRSVVPDPIHRALDLAIGILTTPRDPTPRRSRAPRPPNQSTPKPLLRGRSVCRRSPHRYSLVASRPRDKPLTEASAAVMIQTCVWSRGGGDSTLYRSSQPLPPPRLPAYQLTFQSKTLK
uniref:Uncharacterized protein n=1 Tax=Mesocestoides corti TaxID=53468 RepID=A0A5K3FBI5_MESCO